MRTEEKLAIEGRRPPKAALKLADIAANLAAGQTYSVTRMTVIKTLCKEPVVAQRFAVHLLRRAFPDPAVLAPGADQWAAQRALRLIYSMTPGEPVRNREEALRILDQARNFQGEEKPSQWGAVRVIKSNRLLMFEFALSTFLKESEAGFWAYHLARRYAERYDSQHGTGLLPASASYVRDIASFWVGDTGSPDTAVQGKGGTPKRPTALQGRYLAYIHSYTKLHRCPPAMSEIQGYFHADAPSVHQMILRLEKSGYLARIPFQARSLRVLLPADQIPPLD